MTVQVHSYGESHIEFLWSAKIYIPENTEVQNYLDKFLLKISSDNFCSVKLFLLTWINHSFISVCYYFVHVYFIVLIALCYSS